MFLKTSSLYEDVLFKTNKKTNKQTKKQSPKCILEYDSDVIKKY